MAVLVRADLESVKQYRGKSVSTKIGNKKNQVLFRVVVDDFSLVDALAYAKTDKNIVMLEYQGSHQYLSTIAESYNGAPDLPYMVVHESVGHNIDEEVLNSVLASFPQWCSVVIKLPNDYSNMEFIYNMSQKYPRVRFCGGYVFEIDGCRLGCCGRDIFEKTGVKYSNNDMIKEGCSCCVSTVQFEDVTLDVSSKPERVSKSTSSKASKTPTVKKPKQAMFGSLMQKGAVEF